MKAVDLALVATLGESGATAVKFYVDTSLIYEDPSRFEESLSRLFGSSRKGLDLIEEKIQTYLQDLLAKEHSINVPRRESSTNPNSKLTFIEYVRACKKEYVAKRISVSPNPQ